MQSLPILGSQPATAISTEPQASKGTYAFVKAYAIEAKNVIRRIPL